MLLNRLAVTCVADQRLRNVCSLLLRDGGYRIIETESVPEAIAVLEAKPVTMVVGGALADPEDQLSALAASRNLTYVRLGPGVAIEELLKLFDIIEP